LFTLRSPADTPAPEVSHGDKAKARDILAAIRTLHAVEQAKRPATTDERQALSRFPGCGVVALSLFHDPARYRPHADDRTTAPAGENTASRGGLAWSLEQAGRGP